jgi:hypothetical protein
MVSQGHSFLWLLLPGAWFVGMVLSHLVFGRCVLNVIVSRMRQFKKDSSHKAELYNRRASQVYDPFKRRKTKAVSDEIHDTMPTPDLDPKL